MRGFIGTLVLLLAPTLVQAAAGSGWFGAPGNDRCGLGTIIFRDSQSIASQSSEEILDAVFLNGAFSMTTGTSGCSNGGIVQVPHKELMYANVNFEELTVEMASGQGETVRGLAATMGCAQADENLFMQTTRAKYQNVYTSPAITPHEMMVNLRQQLKGNATLAKSCQSLRGQS